MQRDLIHQAQIRREFTCEVQHTIAIHAMHTSPSLHFALQPNCRFNVDANICHAFGIFMAYVGALQSSAYGAG